MSRQDRARSPLSPQDQAIIDLIAAEYRPQPMNPIRQAAFRQRLSERLARRTQRRWVAAFASATAAAAALLLFVLRPDPTTPQTAITTAADAQVLYAYVDPYDYATESMRDYLPGEYRVIADVIEEDQGESLP